jgi:hypothetical protein
VHNKESDTSQVLEEARYTNDRVGSFSQEFCLFLSSAAFFVLVLIFLRL